MVSKITRVQLRINSNREVSLRRGETVARIDPLQVLRRKELKVLRRSAEASRLLPPLVERGVREADIASIQEDYTKLGKILNRRSRGKQEEKVKVTIGRLLSMGKIDIAKLKIPQVNLPQDFDSTDFRQFESLLNALDKESRRDFCFSLLKEIFGDWIILIWESLNETERKYLLSVLNNKEFRNFWKGLDDEQRRNLASLVIR